MFVDGVFFVREGCKGEHFTPFQYTIPVLLLLVEFAIAHAVRFYIAHALALVLFVFTVRALEEEYLRVALKGKYVSAYTVKEPTVVRDDYGTSGKVFETLFESPQRIYVDVIGRFVEQ